MEKKSWRFPYFCKSCCQRKIGTFLLATLYSKSLEKSCLMSLQFPNRSSRVSNSVQKKGCLDFQKNLCIGVSKKQLLWKLQPFQENTNVGVFFKNTCRHSWKFSLEPVSAKRNSITDLTDIIYIKELFLEIFRNFLNTFKKFCLEFVLSSVVTCRR